MAGYNRGIVATRKLNEKNKARLRDTGDTEFGFIKGRLSHINKDEKKQLTAADAYSISLRERVEEDIARKGAGTINPLTGMPEYHPGDHTGPGIHSESDHISGTDEFDYSTIDPANITITQYDTGSFPKAPGTESSYVTPTGRQDYETLSGMHEGQLKEYFATEFGMSRDDTMKYIEGFKDEPFGFLEEEQELISGEIDPVTGLPIDPTTGTAGIARGFEERGLQSAYGTTMGALGSREESLGLKRGGLGRTTAGGMRQATTAASTAASRSGLAGRGVGTVTQGLERQKQGLFQDYTAGMKGIQIGMEDIGRERGAALETLTLGKEIAGADYEAAIKGADIDFRKDEYLEQQRQLNEMYADVTAVISN